MDRHRLGRRLWFTLFLRPSGRTESGSWADCLWCRLSLGSLSLVFGQVQNISGPKCSFEERGETYWDNVWVVQR